MTQLQQQNVFSCCTSKIAVQVLDIGAFHTERVWYARRCWWSMFGTLMSPAGSNATYTQNMFEVQEDAVDPAISQHAK